VLPKYRKCISKDDFLRAYYIQYICTIKFKDGCGVETALTRWLIKEHRLLSTGNIEARPTIR